MKWIEVEVVTTPVASEAIVAVMYEMGISGLSIEDPRDFEEHNHKPTDWDYIEEELINVDPNKVIIKAYLSENVNYNEKITLLKEKIHTIANYFDVGSGEVNISEVFEEDWASNWKQFYKPVKVGRKVVIKPTWEEYQCEDSNNVIIEMDPGMVFGTGTHETTKMCIQLLEEYVKMDMHVLDVGCGSGILGITALKLGANRCVSVDIDVDAVKVTTENAELNHVADKITAKEGDLLKVVSGEFNIIVANIIADVIISLSTVINPYLNKDGIFIASGIIKDRYEEVKEQLLKNGFIIQKELFMGEWVAVSVAVPR